MSLLYHAYVYLEFLILACTIYILAPSYTGTIGSGRKIYMGTLAGINSGTIQNCAVCGYSMGREGIVYVQRNGSLYMGGLTGSNQGNIFNCEVDAPVLNASVLYGTLPLLVR